MTSGPGENLKKIMIQDGSTNRWFFPFRYISQNFGYNNPTGFTFLEGQLTNDAKETFRLKISLPWKSCFDWYITDEQGT